MRSDSICYIYPESQAWCKSSKCIKSALPSGPCQIPEGGIHTTLLPHTRFDLTACIHKLCKAAGTSSANVRMTLLYQAVYVILSVYSLEHTVSCIWTHCAVQIAVVCHTVHRRPPAVLCSITPKLYRLKLRPIYVNAHTFRASSLCGCKWSL